MTTDLWRECADCAYVPICAGGCRVSAHTLKGDFKKRVCEMRYLERMAKNVIASDSEAIPALSIA